MDAAASASSHQNKKVIWFWQSNPNPFHEKEKEEWKQYSDFENDYIEERFQQKEKEVDLNGYLINFKDGMQIRKDNISRCRPVRRREVDLSQYVREERFSYPERPNKSFDTKQNYKHDLVNRWADKNCTVKLDWPVVAELAAEGILKEGKLLNQDFDAQRMADKLRNVKNRDGYRIRQWAVRLYSAESFLYKLVNTTLRKHDMSKLDTLGPFCWLLFYHCHFDGSMSSAVLYRGATLTDEMIEEYQKAIGTNIAWPAFTSTSEDRRVAEQFGNTLFIIAITNVRHSLSHISSLSNYPDEQEVLIGPQICFKVDSIEHDSESGKYLVYMTSAIMMRYQSEHETFFNSPSLVFSKIPGLTIGIDHTLPAIYKLQFQGLCRMYVSWKGSFVHFMIDDRILVSNYLLPNNDRRQIAAPELGGNVHAVDARGGALFFTGGLNTDYYSNCPKSDIIQLSPGTHVIDVVIRTEDRVSVIGGELLLEFVQYRSVSDIGLTPPIIK